MTDQFLGDGAQLNATRMLRRQLEVLVAGVQLSVRGSKPDLWLELVMYSGFGELATIGTTVIPECFKLSSLSTLAIIQQPRQGSTE
jgi:hypothetical protein